MREADLYPLVRDWLIARGYQVHVEVFGHDVAAFKNGAWTVVELKTSMTWRLMRQLESAAAWADFVMAAVPTEQKKFCGLRSHGFGLLQVDFPERKIRQRVHPKQQPFGWHKRRAYRIKKLSERTPALEHEMAGLPCSGALRIQRDVRQSLGHAR